MSRIGCKSVLLGVLCLMLLGTPVTARTVSITLGDMDGGVYDGPGSVDDVNVDNNWLAESLTVSTHIVDFDIGSKDQLVPFTFEWVMQPDEVVVGAILHFAIRGTDSKVGTDTVRLETVDAAEKYSFVDMGWLPVPTDQIVLRSMDLSSALSRNILPLLQDGQLNGNVFDDTLIDYVTLDLTIAPEPVSVGLLLLGSLALLRRGGKWEGGE